VFLVQLKWFDEEFSFILPKFSLKEKWSGFDRPAEAERSSPPAF
jgi:hypothetical protein